MNQFFWPDSAATSQLLTDLAAGLAERGHEVHVICADGSYAVASNARGPAVQIHRVKALPFTRGTLGRILSYLSFYLGAAWGGLTLARPDVVITLTTPPLLSLLGTMIKLARGARHFIWEMDVYPDVAVSLGYLKAGSLLERGIGLLADFSRRRADGIFALGECMKQRLVARGIAADRIFVTENWADSAAIQPIERPGSEDKPDNKLVILYSGNLGLAHDIETIAQAMLALRQSDRFSFIFTGGGPRRDELASFCRDHAIEAVAFRPYVQRMSLGESLGAGDIGLVTQRDGCTGVVVPSKVYGLMAAARPILFIGPAEATPARLIERFGCGWHVACGDADGLAALLVRLADRPAEVRAAGQRARQALLEHYDLALGVARICNLVVALSQHCSGHCAADFSEQRAAGKQSIAMPSIKNTRVQKHST